LQLDNVILFVTDASGAVGVHAAGQVSERYTGLILADTFAFPLRGRFRLVQFVLRFLLQLWPVRWANRRLNLFTWLVSTLAPYKNPLPKEDRKAYRRLFATHEQRDLILDWFGQLGSNQRFLEATEAGIRGPLADKKVLLVFGQFDPMRLIGSLRRLRQLFARSTSAIIPWEEHFPVLGSAKQVASAILDWRDKVLGETGHGH
jgi:haloalkane dehalogenase